VGGSAQRRAEFGREVQGRLAALDADFARGRDEAVRKAWSPDELREFLERWGETRCIPCRVRRMDPALACHDVAGCDEPCASKTVMPTLRRWQGNIWDKKTLNAFSGCMYRHCLVP
jgi:hypothetical protein